MQYIHLKYYYESFWKKTKLKRIHVTRDIKMKKKPTEFLSEPSTQKTTFFYENQKKKQLARSKRPINNISIKLMFR